MHTTVSLRPSALLIAERALQPVLDLLRRVQAAWQRRRQHQAALAALARLDAGTLRDIGFARSELPSVAAELTGDALPHRVQVLKSLIAPH